MRGTIRYICAFLAVLCLLGAALCGLLTYMMTEDFARSVNAPEEVRLMQQSRIDHTVATLTEVWGVSADTLAPWTEDAARLQGEAAAAWWGALWQDEAADKATPAWLDAEEEAILVADVRRDEGFIANTMQSQRRAIARDEIAYGLDESVCDAVTPLRRGILEMGLRLLADVVPLPVIRQMMVITAGALAVAALALLLLARRMAGCTLLSAGLVMALVTVPVCMADIPGMLAQLNDVAVLQAGNALGCLGVLWYGAAAVMALVGIAIIGLKRLAGRNAE